MNSNLIQKYNVPGPRYTSYPTVPFWNKEGIAVEDWKKTVKKSFKESNAIEGISLYIHLPFCESLCTFCACHKKITTRHEVEQPYIETVLKEWDLYCDLLEERPKIREIHLGGGTPTFMSSESLKRLINGIFKRADKFKVFDFSYEGHPNHTTKEQLQTLFDLGSRRNSFGIQDYDPKVQKAIHRIQSFEQVKKINDFSREIGYESISHDLIFGLPFQTEESIRNTIKNTIALKPDRIAYYSYAHVPWIKGVGQRGFDENDLPHDSEKLHRNFMGYTAGKTELMIGLGMSSISDSWYAFAQNEKDVDDYTARVNKGELPVFRGHLLTDTDLVIRKHILNLMCNLETTWNVGLSDVQKEGIINRLQEIIEDNLVEVTNEKVTVKEEGRKFIRNICMAFDLHLVENKPDTRIFSMTI